MKIWITHTKLITGFEKIKNGEKIKWIQTTKENLNSPEESLKSYIAFGKSLYENFDVNRNNLVAIEYEKVKNSKSEFISTGKYFEF